MFLAFNQDGSATVSLLSLFDRLLWLGLCRSTEAANRLRQPLTRILEKRGRRTVLRHRDALVVLVHDITERNCRRACEKHVLTQIRQIRGRGAA
jgi:hypothetical protein